ncbi:chitobiase/beta-hexosaminidase C-terminal domain-containing protein [Bacteroidota bacterium]
MKRNEFTHLILTFIAISLLLTSCEEILNKEEETSKLKVSFSEPGGEYEDRIELILNCEEEGAEIWYTMDGSTEPEKEGEGSILYTGSIAIVQTTTIKAIAYLDDEKGTVYSETYTYAKPVSAGFFAYYEGSYFEFLIKDEASATTGTKLLWEVEEYVENTRVAKILATKGGNEQTMFYLRESSFGLEYSKTGGNWKYLVNTSMDASDLGFIYVTKAADPSSLLGSVNNEVKITNITTSAGSFSVFMNKSEYDNSSRDNYMYIDDNIEYYNKDVGFVKSYAHVYDGSDYPPWVYHREIELVGYYIVKPDGSILQGGKEYDVNSAPEAPSDLTGERISSSIADLAWTDNSLFEDNFILERSEYTTSVSKPLPKLIILDKNTISYTDSTLTSGKSYVYRVKAKNSYGESDYTDDLVVNIYGVPEAPWDLTAGYNRNLYFVYILCWARYSDNISHFVIAYYGSQGWSDLDFTIDADPDDVYNDKWLQSLRIYYSGGKPWPSGTYRFKVKAVNSYGESLYSEEVEVEI